MGQQSILCSFMLLLFSPAYGGEGNTAGHTQQRDLQQLRDSVCSSWDATQELKGQSLDRLGESMVFSGDGRVLAVTGGGFITTQSGFVRLYQYETNQWRQIGNQIRGTNKNDERRRSVALSMNGRMVAFGERSFLSTIGTSILPGHVRVYQYSENDKRLDSSGTRIDRGRSIKFWTGCSFVGRWDNISYWVWFCRERLHLSVGEQ